VYYKQILEVSVVATAMIVGILVGHIGPDHPLWSVFLALVSVIALWAVLIEGPAHIDRLKEANTAPKIEKPKQLVEIHGDA
jgi:hypothetical protein